MTEASSPTLPAIRERLERAEQAKAAWNAGAADERERLDHYGPADGDWQAFLTRALTADRTLGSAWAALLHHAPADLAFLLALVARLQGERDGLEKALINVAETCEDDGVSRCWCDIEHRAQMREESAIPHRDFCRAARAALGEE